MKTLTEVLVEADPLRHESTWAAESRQRTRQIVLDAARPVEHGNGVLLSFAALFALTLVVAAAIGLLRSNAVVAATIHFEVRLAEDRLVPGLEEMTIEGSDRKVYLHPETIVSNGDIIDARVVEINGGFGVAVTLSAEGASKMLRATKGHIGRPLAILLDGEVATAPTIRGAIGASAVLDGDYTRAEAERIAIGIQGQ